jgi:hypothetical protein
MKRIWVGAGFNYFNAKRFKTEEEFTFGGKVIPVGANVFQFETTNYCWTIWDTPDTKNNVAEELKENKVGVV